VEKHNTTQMRVKFLTTISLASLVVFLVQFFLFNVFFARWTFFLIISWLSGFRYSPKENIFDKFLNQILMSLTYPIRFLLRGSSFDDGSSVHTVLLLAANSVIWGIGIAILIYSLSKLARRNKAI
jgi:hypothetical protein